MTDWIKEIRERCEELTKGPWANSKTLVYSLNEDFIGIKKIASWIENEHDACFIAHAPEDISDLLAEVDRLNEDHEGNMEALQGWYDDYQELETKNKCLLKTLKDICKTLEDNGGTIDRPKRITWDVVHQVYDLARKGLEEAK